MRIRIACMLVLLSLAALFAMVLDTRGATAIAFVFAGFPLLGLGIAFYVASERRRIALALARTMADDWPPQDGEPNDAALPSTPDARSGSGDRSIERRSR